MSAEQKHCHHPRHGTPCPLPCAACEDECAEDECQHCGVVLSATFGFGCCDECSERLAREFEAYDAEASK
jgi:hypothetical protein